MSTSGVKCAAAVIPIELSIMQPTMTIRPCARAIAIIRSASRRLPHLASLMLIPSTLPTSGGMSTAVMQLSSAMTGMSARRGDLGRDPSSSSGGSGCSSTVTPNSCSTGKHGDGLLDRPAAVGVDPDLLVGRVPDGAENLHVAIGAQLDLEDRVLLGLEHLGPDLFRRVEPDREGGPGRLGGVETPEPVDRHAEPLADEIVQRGGQRGAGGGIAHAASAPSAAPPPRDRRGPSGSAVA